jgi:CRP-like cAMP-binding protein
LSDNEKNIIAERCQIKDLKRHENLYHKGQDGDYFYIIINGSVEVYLPNSSETSRTEEVVDILRKGDTLGIVFILEKKPHSFSARALGNVRLLLIDEKDLTYIMQTIPSFNAIITRVLSKRLKASIGETKRKVIERVIRKRKIRKVVRVRKTIIRKTRIREIINRIRKIKNSKIKRN